MFLRIRRYYDACLRIGIINVLLFLWKTKLLNRLFTMVDKDRKNYRIGYLFVKNLTHPIQFRYNSSDIDVFWQIFILNTYKYVKIIDNVEFILDCGANVGYSSIYFALNFPDAKIIAIEPDKLNCKLAKINIEPYNQRITLLHSALWSHITKLKIHSGEYRDHLEWSTVVRECIEGEEPDIETIDIFSILNQYNNTKIDILKIDIEGAEKQIFTKNYQQWINMVRLFAIELHDYECQKIFNNALDFDQFSVNRYGSTTIAVRNKN